MAVPHVSLDYQVILQKRLHYVSVREQDVNDLPRVYCHEFSTNPGCVTKEELVTILIIRCLLA